MNGKKSERGRLPYRDAPQNLNKKTQNLNDTPCVYASIRESRALFIAVVDGWLVR